MESESENESEDFCSEETEDAMSNQCLNLAIEYYLISAKSKDKASLRNPSALPDVHNELMGAKTVYTGAENSFDCFHEGIKDYFNNKGYKVVDEHLFKSLIHTFHILAENEEENISKKKQTDEKFKKEYKKTGKKRDLKKMEKEDLPDEEEEKEPRVNTDFISNSVKHRRIKNMIPGFSIIKNRIITPLLIASEKVVEYMIPEQKEKASTDLPPEENIENTLEQPKDDSFLNIQMSKLSLEELERHQRKRSVKCLTKSNHNVQISKNLMNKASD